MYIGAPAFGARQAAGNSLEDLEEVVTYAHMFGVQVLVTLNTLLRDDEYPQAVELAHALYKIGVDALIIQDLNLLNFDLPPIRLHASTQCDNRTAEQAIRMQQLGFKRIVLARELSINEISAIHRAVAEYSAEHHQEPIELEAFVHGALCVSYSGRCYISEVLANRSANRGACAQYCRMAYDLLDKDMNEVRDEKGAPIHQRYLLSLQDMDRSAYLKELIEAGVTTFKIEGRLKDADYVTNITAYYREKINNLTANEGERFYSKTVLQRKRSYSEAVYKQEFIPNPAKTFHRGGIDYLLHGRTTHMANWDTPKSTGEYIGEVLEARGNTLRVRLKEGVTLHNGDGLTIGADGCNVNGINGNIILVNKRLAPSGENLRKGAIPLFRNLDTEFVRNLHSERKIPVDILFKETEDGFELQYKAVPSGRVWVGSFVYTHEPANNPGRAIETIRTQLSKLGDTPYVAHEIHIETKPYFIPISLLNEWRRQVLTTSPEAAFQSQITNHQSPITDHQSPITNHQSPITDHQSPITNHQSSITNHQSQISLAMPNNLMTCKYCLLFESGHCRKTNPYPAAQEPRFLRLRNNTLLQLTFDCKNCQMLVNKA
ncbi:MAG: U32 family peptidase [Paludibacteraceae bacterium]|nr:U32 family peptidase [Paludibacteraceae bacterium]